MAIHRSGNGTKKVNKSCDGRVKVTLPRFALGPAVPNEQRRAQSVLALLQQGSACLPETVAYFAGSNPLCASCRTVCLAVEAIRSFQLANTVPLVLADAYQMTLSSLTEISLTS